MRDKFERNFKILPEAVYKLFFHENYVGDGPLYGNYFDHGKNNSSYCNNNINDLDWLTVDILAY